LFRITQEALTNVAKHANASHATVTLEIQPTQIGVCINDDGRGFDPQEALRGDIPYTGWGLLGIQERTALLGGQYKIESEPGSGARISVRVPLVREATNVQDTAIVG
jgi:signal transduction histidine kinase